MDKKRIHFIGIGGIGVSALARYYLAQGVLVSGSDAVESGITEELRALGAEISISNNSPQPPLNLRGGEEMDLVVYSAAVREDNPELVEARRQGIKCQKYAEALGELTKQKYTIAVSGMHGKSTTTAMIGLILEAAGLDPTVIVGTKVKWNKNIITPSQSSPSKGEEENYSNCRVGKSKYLVIEADEYDRSFLNYWPKLLVLLNIEEEHLDTYQDLADILQTFEKYVGQVDKDGWVVANEEDENIGKIVQQAKCKKVYYSSSETRQAGRIEKLRDSVLDFVPRMRASEELRSNNNDRLRLKVSGQYNISNANAALAVAEILGIEKKIAVEALNNFNGTWRRMEYKGEINGARIYDDYGHHPTEIRATLTGARELLNRQAPGGKLWLVFQPHQYQRTYKLFDKFITAFDGADKLILLPIYSVEGREDDDIKKKVSSATLAEKIEANNQEVLCLNNFEETVQYLRNNLKLGDICVVMGAGDIYKLTELLLSTA